MPGSQPDSAPRLDTGPQPAIGPESASGPESGAGLTIGARGTVSVVVTQADMAEAAGSGDVPVLATPRLLALAEAATVAAVAAHLGHAFRRRAGARRRLGVTRDH